MPGARFWSGSRDLNPGPRHPDCRALTRLRYSPPQYYFSKALRFTARIGFQSPGLPGYFHDIDMGGPAPLLFA